MKFQNLLNLHINEGKRKASLNIPFDLEKNEQTIKYYKGKVKTEQEDNQMEYENSKGSPVIYG